MPKNIVICCDGTGNSFENAQEDSNVVKLYECLVIDKRQVAYYHPGVGTMGDPTARFWLTKQFSRIRGLAFGNGLMAVIADAYRYLMNTYEDGDHVYLIGFSRGAFTVRVLSSLLHVYGLLCAGNEGLIPYVLRLYQKQSRDADHKCTLFVPDKAFQWAFSHSKKIKIDFCGVWDTVSTYGWVYSPIKLPFLGENPLIKTGRHAISLHERRCYYQDNLWGKMGRGQDIRQVWFSGVHSDVGGSYPEADSGLSKFPLEWMMVEADKAGLLLNCERVQIVLGRTKPEPAVPQLPDYVPPTVLAKKHDELEKLSWWIPEYFPQHDDHAGRPFYVPRGRFRTIPEDSLLHESVREREQVVRWDGPALPKKYGYEPLVPYRVADPKPAAARMNNDIIVADAPKVETHLIQA